jgi:hypothetical protein
MRQNYQRHGILEAGPLDDDGEMLWCALLCTKLYIDTQDIITKPNLAHSGCLTAFRIRNTQERYFIKFNFPVSNKKGHYT